MQKSGSLKLPELCFQKQSARIAQIIRARRIRLANRLLAIHVMELKISLDRVRNTTIKFNKESPSQSRQDLQYMNFSWYRQLLIKLRQH
jgi:hypothetical protein